jgi:hypothetical protein
MALSILPNEEIKGYSFAFRYLRDNTLYNSFKEIKIMPVIETNSEYEFPIAVLYGRKPEIENISYPLHIFCLYYRNFMFQICFPFHDEIIKIKHKECLMKTAPYILFGEKLIDNPKIKARYTVYLQSLEQIKRDSSIVLKMKEEELKNSVCFDSKTGINFPGTIKNKEE